MTTELAPRKRTIWSRIEEALEHKTALDNLKADTLNLVSTYGESLTPTEGGHWLATHHAILDVGDGGKVRIYARAGFTDSNHQKVRCVQVRAEEYLEKMPLGEGLMLYTTDGKNSWGASGDVLYGEDGQEKALVLTSIVQLIRDNAARRQVASYRPQPLEWENV